ncbi:hypothetical protein [Levilactobacillus brevis]|uniref:hypothetical protein n=1 Tax=Levilactobacillus brevis TaxID=1580 RepID=UPI00339C2595
MNPTIRKLIFILFSELTPSERVKFFGKIPKKKAPLTTRMPEGVQRKIIADALKSKSNIDFVLKQLTNNTLHYLIGDDSLYEVDSIKSNKELVSRIKKYKLHTDKLLLSMFETTKLENINSLFPSDKEIEELLKITQEIKAEERKNINKGKVEENCQKLEYKDELNELRRIIVKKDKILDSNKKKYEQTIKRITTQNKNVLQDCKNKMEMHEKEVVKSGEDSIQKVCIEKENVYKKLRNEQSKNSQLMEMIKQYQENINKLRSEISQRKVLLVADKGLIIKDVKGIIFSRTSEEDSLNGVAVSIEKIPVSEIWVVREQVSGIFFHKLQQEFKYMRIRRVSLADLLSKGE